MRAVGSLPCLNLFRQVCFVGCGSVHTATWFPAHVVLIWVITSDRTCIMPRHWGNRAPLRSAHAVQPRQPAGYGQLATQCAPSPAASERRRRAAGKCCLKRERAAWLSRMLSAAARPWCGFWVPVGFFLGELDDRYLNKRVTRCISAPPFVAAVIAGRLSAAWAKQGTV